MKKSTLLEAYNAHVNSTVSLNDALVDTIGAFGHEGIVFGEFKRPFGMDEDRDEFQLTAIRFNSEKDGFEAKTEKDDWFPIHTDLGYENFIDLNELAAFVLQQDVFED